MLCSSSSSQVGPQENSGNGRASDQKEMGNKFHLCPKLQYMFFLHSFFTTTGQGRMVVILFSLIIMTFISQGDNYSLQSYYSFKGHTTSLKNFWDINTFDQTFQHVPFLCSCVVFFFLFLSSVLLFPHFLGQQTLDDMTRPQVSLRKFNSIQQILIGFQEVGAHKMNFTNISPWKLMISG